MARKKDLEALQEEVNRLNSVIEEQSIIHHETDRQLEEIRLENSKIMTLNEMLANERDRLHAELTHARESATNLLEAISVLGRNIIGNRTEQIWFGKPRFLMNECGAKPTK